MDRSDVHAALVSTLSSRHGQKVIKAQGKLQFRCPRHDDKTPSAWLGKFRWGCFACGFEEPLSSLCDELGVERPSYGLTVEEYADRKGFSIANLTRWGVHTGTSDKGATVVVIPYRAADGSVLRNKFRGPKGSWWEGSGRPTYLYGLDMLAKAPITMPVIVVEGESDCHACWTHAVLAVGVPGANGWRKEWAQYLEGRQVYVWQEPDQGGAALVRSVSSDIPGARVIQPDGVKDLADLHRALGKGFADAVAQMLSDATPIAASPTVPFDVAAGRALEQLIQDKQKPIDVVRTPLPAWNAACRGAGGGEGLARGWHLLLAGNTGHGKSLAALNVAAHAIKQGERVGFVSLEMGWDECVTRLLPMVTGIPVQALEQGRHFDVAQHRKANAEMTRLYTETGGGVFVNRDELYRLEDIEASVRYLVGVLGCRFIITDYLQLAWVQSAKSILDNTIEVSHTIRRLAKELGVVSLGLSQFTRETSKNYDDPPTAQGLMGGSPLENDAVQILLLDHSSYTRVNADTATTKLILDKNRHGPCLEIGLTWDYTTLQMRERYLTSEEEV